jgi:hypothetical protein
MGHAETATNDHALDLGAGEFSAFLRLRQGGASRTTWNLTEAPGGTMISVGADAACDWQIRAAFVPARAFSILVVGGRSFVRSGPEPGLLLDGKPVDDSWNPLPARARIDIGLARFEVRSGYADMAGEEPVLDLSQPRREPTPDPRVGAWAPSDAMANTAVVQRQAAAASVQTAPARSTRRKQTMQTQEYGWHGAESSRVQRVGTLPERQPRRPEVAPAKLVTPAASPRPKTMRNSTIELNMDDLDYVGTIPLPRGNERTGEYAVSPSLLGSDEITRVTGSARGLRYVGMGCFFASAYGAWLYLLDRL